MEIFKLRLLIFKKGKRLYGGKKLLQTETPLNLGEAILELKKLALGYVQSCNAEDEDMALCYIQEIIRVIDKELEIPSLIFDPEFLSGAEA